ARTGGARMTAVSPGLRLASPAGRRVLAATVLGSGAVFLEGTVVNVAMPAMAADLGFGLAGVQWVINGYLLTLSALMLLGGSLGDVHRHRRVFLAGLVAFAAASLAAALMPTLGTLVAVRLIQGAAGALLVPNSLAIVDRAFAEEDRGAAIGHWAGWSGVSTAAGPLLGGWLVDAASWRWVFASAAPLALAAAWIAWRRWVPEPPGAAEERRSVDYAGAALATAGLAGLVGGLIVGTERGFGSPPVIAALAGGGLALAAFLLLQRRRRDPLLPLGLFRSRQFTGANLTTLCVYGALGTLFLFLALELQNVLGMSALAAGAALLPVNALMLALSPAAGRLASRTGPRLPMTVGPLVAAAGIALLAGVGESSGYWSGVLPGVVLFALGLALVVAPLTAAVLGAVPDDDTGVASAVNNAAARLAGLLTVAAVPLLAGLGGLDDLGGAAFAAGYRRVMLISAGLCALGGLVALVTVGDRAARVAPGAHPCPPHGCVQRRPLGRSEAGRGRG
ncbi:MAG TPA: MFS transporter, partial [Thermoanaerobaculia bacterium]|nr:MFS transporter [Thermoanaerobaculia bacterium]